METFRWHHLADGTREQSGMGERGKRRKQRNAKDRMRYKGELEGSAVDGGEAEQKP